ncbi:uncharacterized protein PgNI_00588 [Pyricularia grisea]|uniref:Uncharacterized protein n=1 Tax=Pyricularia grisea TaxID=148305 RepID=A0A6P8BG00_PYRGI|nr:uncharacterized protein PgNI_00588 [Pyricularia grisea]TLD15572.1 hypothetical protein PgNI_00588 [Pyricularia grisea]
MLRLPQVGVGGIRSMQTALRRRAAIDRERRLGGSRGAAGQTGVTLHQELGPNTHWRGYSGGRHKAPARMQCTTYRARYKASGVWDLLRNRGSRKVPWRSGDQL